LADSVEELEQAFLAQLIQMIKEISAKPANPAAVKTKMDTVFHERVQDERKAELPRALPG
jgi:hypothetical protein